MRHLLVILALVSTAVSAAPVAGDDPPPIADHKAQATWSAPRLVLTIPYHDFAGTPVAHAFVYQTAAGPFFGEAALRAELAPARARARTAAQAGDDDRFVTADRSARGEDRFGTVVVSDRDDDVPIPEYSSCLPRAISARDEAEQRARAELGSDARFVGMVYAGPGSEWFEFAAGERRVLIDAYRLQPYTPPATLTRARPERPTTPAIVEAWQRNRAAASCAVVDSSYIPDVPWTLWNYGCTPSASAMLMWYWDRRGYSRLVDYHFDRYDLVTKSSNFNLPNVQQELAQAMGTDTVYSGGTGIGAIAGGHLQVANNRHGYSFHSSTDAYGEAAEDWYWSSIVNEINAGRPTHWAVLNYLYGGEYINHSVCAIGYLVDGAANRFVTIHNTWDTGEYHWSLFTAGSNSSVVTLEPGGGDSNSVYLTFPYDESAPLIAGLHYRVRYHAAGSELARIELYLAQNDRREEWQFVDTLSCQDTAYVWQVPDSAFGGRFNVLGYDRYGNYIAGDGSFRSFKTQVLPAGTNLTLVGHLPGQCQDLDLRGTAAFAAGGGEGLGVADLATPELPWWSAHVTWGGFAQALCASGDLVLIASNRDGLAIARTTDGAPSVIGQLALAGQAKAVVVVDTFAYVACYDQGLAVVNFARPDQPTLVTTVPLDGYALDLSVDGDHLFVACASAGIAELSLAARAAPAEVARYATANAARSVAATAGVLYACEGASGVEAFDRTTPGRTKAIATRGQALMCAADGAFLYVADGSAGVSVYDVTFFDRPRFEGYAPTMGAASALVPFGSYLYVALGSGGIAVFQRVPPLAVAEPPTAGPRLALAPIGTVRDRLTLRFTLAEPGTVRFSISDLLGRLVGAWVETRTAGVHEVVRPLAGVPAGVYFVQATLPGAAVRAKFVRLD